MTRKPDQQRAYFGFVVAVLLGWFIGILIKQVRLGLILGLALGLFGSLMLRRR